MPSVVRAFRDLTRGHCFNPTIFIEGSEDTFVNGLPVVREGDRILTHHCQQYSHDGSAAPVNTSNFYVNGLLVEINGDPVSCGDTASNGSEDTFAG